jgi:hypothetical protein
MTFLHVATTKKLATNSTCVAYIGMLYLYHSKRHKTSKQPCKNIKGDTKNESSRIF